MVGQAVAAAVAPVVVSSATQEDGLINKAFKIVMIGALLGIALALIYAISLLGGSFDLEDFDLLNFFFGNVIEFSPFTLIGAGISALGSLVIRR